MLHFQMENLDFSSLEINQPQMYPPGDIWYIWYLFGAKLRLDPSTNETGQPDKPVEIFISQMQVLFKLTN